MADALSGGGEKSIGKSGSDGGHTGLADARGAFVAGHDVDLDGRRFGHANNLEVVEVALLDATIFERDF